MCLSDCVNAEADLRMCCSHANATGIQVSHDAAFI